MSSSLPDPNNHVPGVTPSDSWDDTGGRSASGDVLIVTLPRKRPAPERQLVETPHENGDAPLRIGLNPVRADSPGSARRIEVQEISGEVIRLEGAVPVRSKAARKVPFLERGVGVEDQENPQGEGRDWGVADHMPIRWLLGSGAAVAAVIILLMFFLPKFNAMNAMQTDPEKGAVKVEIKEKIEGMEAMDRLLSKQTEAMQIYRTYTRATHFDDIVPLLRRGASLKETLRKSWRPMNISKQWAPAADSDWNLIEQGGHPCAMLIGTLPDHTPYTAYFTNEGNRLLLDWKATTAYGTASFGELAENQGNADEIRGLISIAEFYSDAWPEEDYQSYRLVSPDGETSIWCYSRRKDPGGAALAELFRKGEITEESQTTRKITLRLERGPVNARPNQWLIREMLHIDWLIP